MYVDCLVRAKEEVVDISITPPQGDQSSIHKVRGVHLFPFPFLEHSEVLREYMVVVVGRGAASSERVG